MRAKTDGVVRVKGSGKVFTELELIFSDKAHESEARGFYIKIENEDGQKNGHRRMW